MLHLLSAVALLHFLPTIVSAQCAACDSYTAALKSCQTTSANVTEVGTTMDSTTIHCMCTSDSGDTDMNACEACVESTPSTNIEITVLAAWTTTCQADGQFGVQQAAACWESQPSNDLPCVSKTGGSGSGSVDGGTESGGDVAATSTLAGATSSTRSATTSPTTIAKSDAKLSYQAPVIVSFFVLGLGIAIEL